MIGGDTMRQFFFPLMGLVAIVGCDSSSPSTNKPLPTTSEKSDVLAGAHAGVGPGGIVKLTGENTKVKFVGTKPGGSHTGGFGTVTGQIAFRKHSPGATPKEDERGAIDSINVEIDATSLTSDDPRLTNHLKSDDFFKVQKFPKIAFRSTKILTPTGKPEELVVHGELEILGQKKAISFPAKIAMDRGLFHLKSDFKLNRHEIGIDYKPPQGSIDDEVSITVEVGTEIASPK
jgi:polyisoprenoid-binding protein YceI